MNRDVGRRIILAVLAVWVVSLSPMPSAAQRHIGGGGDDGGSCPGRLVSSDGPNPGNPGCGPWASSCGGSYLATQAADSVYECAQEVSLSCPGAPTEAFFEWIWTFVDVQPGALYLTFKGRSDGQRFLFMYKFSDPTQPCPVHVYTLVPDTTLDMTTDRPGGITVRLLPWTQGGRLCLLLRRMGGARPVGEDFPAQVRMDFLKVTTDPLVSCARP